MGRYYHGDIEGKFWFGVQASDAADRFGVKGEPQYISYTFTTDDLPEVEKELKQILKNLGEYKEKMYKYFSEHPAYSNEDLAKYLSTTEEHVQKLLSEYADYELGCQIRDYVKERGECWFEAEI